MSRPSLFQSSQVWVLGHCVSPEAASGTAEATMRGRVSLELWCFLGGFLARWTRGALSCLLGLHFDGNLMSPSLTSSKILSTTVCISNAVHFLFDSIVECRLRLEDCECNKELGFRLAERVDSGWSGGTWQAVFYCGILNQASNNQLLCLLYLHSHISIGGIYRSRTVSTRKLCHMQPPPF